MNGVDNQEVPQAISNRLLTTAPRVLVVDGSRVVRKLISRVLNDEPYVSADVRRRVAES